MRQYRYHGDPGVLERVWENALIRSAGLPKGKFALAYYSPVLHLGTPQGNNAFGQLSEFERDLVAKWLIQLGVPTPQVQGLATQSLRDGLDWLVRTGRADGLTQAVVASTFREVATYLDPLHAVRRDKARHAVADVITKVRPAVVVAHSLGSVVAYETLWSWPSLKVDLFLTLGSPLALPGVFAGRLDPLAGAKCRRPPGVTRWVNVADVGDLIAVPKLLGKHCGGIDLDVEVTIGSVAFHGIEAYLACPRVAGILTPYLEGMR